MFKLIIGLFMGMLLTGALFMGVLAANPANGQSGDFNLTDMLPDITGIYHESLISPLQEAGKEVTDSDIGRMYQKLLREYELNELSREAGQGENFNPAKMLPDIQNINRVAITLPLEEAGKNIQDEEIAQFYSEFLESAGLTAQSN
ncbi:MAG: hypothetical protein V3V23_01785 [Dehalococcoidales bacterium]